MSLYLEPILEKGFNGSPEHQMERKSRFFTFASCDTERDPGVIEHFFFLVARTRGSEFRGEVSWTENGTDPPHDIVALIFVLVAVIVVVVAVAVE